MTKSRFKYRKINPSKKSRKRKNKRTSNIKGGHITTINTPLPISLPNATQLMINEMEQYIEEANRINREITNRLANGAQLRNQEIMVMNNMKTILMRIYGTMSNYDFHDKEEYLQRIRNLIAIFTKHQNDILTANVNALTQDIRRFISILNNESEEYIKEKYYTIKRFIKEDFEKIDNMNRLVNADREKDTLKMIYDELKLELERVTSINKKSTLNKSRV
jgi:hypothetical protein